MSTWEAALALLDSMHPMRAVILDVRLPRVLGGALVGANLAVAGLLLQTTVRNPLADPGILGVTAGAGVAALVVILLFPEQIDWMPWAAFIGGILAVGVVLALSWSRDGRGGALRMVLSGVALQAIFFACIALLTFAFADRAPSFVSFTVGSLNGTGWSDVKMLIAPTLIGLTASVIAIRPLDLLLLDDGTATGLGLAVRHVRLLAASTAALLAASAVSVAGLIGFVGLVVPNGMRLVVGPEHKILLPLSALVGASLVLLADVVSRMALAPLELPVGAFMALIGGPYFLYLLWRKLP
ncbi:iron ABC transporter permease [Myxococcota bacterium]|nr:iron ABC transporter permease [Myxococcota bacterium]